MEWLKSQFLSNDYHSSYWRSFIALDIEHVYIEFRSICDYLASLIVLFYDKVPKKCSNSLYTLIIWVYKNKDKNVLLKELLEKNCILESESNIYTTWFGHMREIRDSIAHKGSEAMVFGEARDGLLFQVLNPRLITQIAKLKHILFNESGVLYFDRYFSIQFSCLMNFIEDISIFIMKKYSIEYKIVKQSGFNTIHDWLSKSSNEFRKFK